MFERIGIGVGLVCVLLGTGCSTSRPHGQYAPIQYEASDDVLHVAAGPDGQGGAEIRAAVDVMSMTPSARQRREQRRVETQARRKNMSVGEKVVDHLQMNWGKYAVAGGLIVADRYAYNNDALWYDWFGLANKKGGSSVPTGGSMAINTHVAGSGNTVYQNIVVQMPAGSGAGMGGSAGVGGQGNTTTSTTTTGAF
jgi:hypothetical protein